MPLILPDWAILMLILELHNVLQPKTFCTNNIRRYVAKLELSAIAKLNSLYPICSKLTSDTKVISLGEKNCKLAGLTEVRTYNLDNRRRKCYPLHHRSYMIILHFLK